uniref:Uncharacterized protein n=1 Tax=candidate division WOR-3 bacterium TaxID=2052148 RepID=A0A7C4X925_UNCW3
MKRFISYILILLVLGGIFGLSIHQQNIKTDNYVVGSVLEILTPAVAAADSDTAGAPKPPAPPPPIN